MFTDLLAVLNASTTMGRAYEVDPTLRPEGRRGPLSRTVDSFVAYWERWAETWEFQAMLKARPVAGDRELGQELIDRAEPFVYPADLDPGVVAEIRGMKGRVESKPEVVRHGERQVKLGPGGLRDIEFAVQLLQLVHGRGDPSLRSTGTLPALEALADGGYVADEDAATFARAYRTLRTVEHRLQLANERRTHTIPDDDERQERLARSLGYAPRGTWPPAGRSWPSSATCRARSAPCTPSCSTGPCSNPTRRSPQATPTSCAAGAWPTRRLASGSGRSGSSTGAALRDVRSLTAGVTRRPARCRRCCRPSCTS